jgi:hypothetical protein
VGCLTSTIQNGHAGWQVKAIVEKENKLNKRLREGLETSNNVPSVLAYIAAVGEQKGPSPLTPHLSPLNPQDKPTTLNPTLMNPRVR